MHLTAGMTELVHRYVTVHQNPPGRITVGALFHHRWVQEMNAMRGVEETDPLTRITEFLGIQVEVCLEPIGLWDPGMIVPPKCPEPEPGSMFAPGFAARAGLL